MEDICPHGMSLHKRLIRTGNLVPILAGAAVGALPCRAPAQALPGCNYANRIFLSAVRDVDHAVFHPVSDLEGYIHWKTEIFKITPSDLWHDEVPFVDFRELCTSPALCRIAVIEDNNGAVHNDFIVASIGELPTPNSMMKIVRGQPGILKFVNESDKESMVITVDQKEYPIQLSQLFLSGKLVQNLDEVKTYCTDKLTVLFDRTGREVHCAFHPIRPDLKLEAERCLIEVTHNYATNDGFQVYVMTGKYKGVIFSYNDDKLKGIDDFEVLDCDILLSESNTFVLGDFSRPESRRSITPTGGATAEGSRGSRNSGPSFNERDDRHSGPSLDQEGGQSGYSGSCSNEGGVDQLDLERREEGGFFQPGNRQSAIQSPSLQHGVKRARAYEIEQRPAKMAKDDVELDRNECSGSGADCGSPDHEGKHDSDNSDYSDQ